jgi:ribosomal protein S18
MPRVGFNPTIQVFEWAKTVHATVTGLQNVYQQLIAKELTRARLD